MNRRAFIALLTAPHDREECMNRKQRIASQRALVQEALGKLNAATEMFGIEDEADMTAQLREATIADFRVWDEHIKRFESWLWDESPIA